jgi:hypothetical protein
MKTHLNFKAVLQFHVCLRALGLILASFSFAGDTDTSRRTLSGVKGVSVVVEDLQPDLQKRARRQALSKDQLRKNVEAQSKETGIRVFDRDEGLRTPGRPVLYVNVNTHQYQKYRFAYDVRTKLQ